VDCNKCLLFNVLTNKRHNKKGVIFLNVNYSFIDFIKFITKSHITFLDELNVETVNKSASYHKMFKLEHDYVKDFILKLDDDKIYVITPFISINCRYDEPYLNLSQPFFVTNQSNYNLIYDYLYEQLEKALIDFEMDDSYWFLFFKFTPVDLDSDKILMNN
jgi:hypothetical protein